MKRLVWLGSSLDDVRAFPSEARRDTGYQLYKIQMGIEASDWKSMSNVGPGVQEVRIHMGGEYRVLYVAKFEEAVYVLHGFEKNRRRTSQSDLAVARQRLQALLKERSHR